MQIKNIATFFTVMFLAAFMPVIAQDDIYPAKPYNGLLFIKNATIHIGNG